MIVMLDSKGEKSAKEARIEATRGDKPVVGILFFLSEKLHGGLRVVELMKLHGDDESNEI